MLGAGGIVAGWVLVIGHLGAQSSGSGGAAAGVLLILLGAAGVLSPLWRRSVRWAVPRPRRARNR